MDRYNASATAGMRVAFLLIYYFFKAVPRVRTVTLNQNHQFRRLYRRHPAGVSPVLVTYAAKNRLNQNRIGITTTKKIGKAHQRNRARRVIREAWRALESCVLPGYDFVFVARVRTTECRMQEVLRTMQKQLAPYFSHEKPS